jgi:alkylation response protein AidB-like acyl-CoA dehydrogenase
LKPTPRSTQEINTGEVRLETIIDDDLRQLSDALRGVLGYGKDEGAPTPDLNWTSNWPTLAELGLASFCVPEARGGFGTRADAAVIAAYALGEALSAAPFAGIAASALALASSDDEAASLLLDHLLDGTRTCAFGKFARDGVSAYSVDGASATDSLLLLDRGTDELVLFTESSMWIVGPAATDFDVSRRCVDVMVDPSRGIRLAPVPRAVELHGLLLAADAVACVARMLDRTTTYAADRIAFGRPIGGYQAVQHRLVDHTIRARGMRLIVGEAARLIVKSSEEAARHVALAELSVSSGALHILHDLLQLTGGIGFTWEYGLHLYERRVHQDAKLSSNPREAARTLAALEGWINAR